MPKGKKHSPEQIVAILRRIDGGESAQAVSHEVNISEATLHRWKQQYGAMEIDEVKELKEGTRNFEFLVSYRGLPRKKTSVAACLEPRRLSIDFIV